MATLHYLRLFRELKLLFQDFDSLKKIQGFYEALHIMSFQMTCRSCTDEVRVKVPSFQKVTLLSQQLNQRVLALTMQVAYSVRFIICSTAVKFSAVIIMNWRQKLKKKQSSTNAL